MPVAEVTTERRPAPPSLTALPTELEQYLVAGGFRWSWQQSSRDAFSLLYQRGIRPLRVEDITDERVKTTVKDALMVNDNGHLQLSDGVLCVQSLDAHEADLQRKALTRDPEQQAADDIGALEQKLQELFGRTGHHDGRPILSGKIPTLSQQVVNAPGAPGVTIGA